MNFLFEHSQIVIAIVVGIFIGIGKIWEKIKPAVSQWIPEEDGEPEFKPARPVNTDYRKKMPPPLPRATVAAAIEPEFERQRKMLERLKTNRAGEAIVAVKTKAKMNVKKPALVSPSRIRASLRSKSEVRHAFVMSEVLGPPAALK